MAGAANKSKIVRVVVSIPQLGDAANVVDLLALDGAHAAVTQLAHALVTSPDEVDDRLRQRLLVIRVVVIPGH